MDQPNISDYDRSGYDYTKYWNNRQYEHKIETLTLNRLLPSTGGQILDIGGGFGRLAQIYYPKYQNSTLFDYSQRSLDIAQQNAKAQEWNHFHTVQGDLYHLPFANQEFDCIIMIRVLHHLEDPLQAFQEIQRVLKPGGTFILEMANKIHLKALLKAWARGNFGYRNDLAPVQHTSQVINGQAGIFYNFHPTHIQDLLSQAGLKVNQAISVENLRLPILKQVLPEKVLIGLDQALGAIFTPLKLGPSLWLRCENSR
jgi:ubiquinone/menaquinone biosynthesis C-methylase UbiE